MGVCPWRDEGGHLGPEVLPVRADRLVDLVDDAVSKDQRREADGGGDLAERDEDGLLLRERADGVWQPRDDGRQRLGYAALADLVDVDVITFVRRRSLLKCLSVCRWSYGTREGIDPRKKLKKGR